MATIDAGRARRGLLVARYVDDIEGMVRRHRACCDGPVCDALAAAVRALLVDAGVHDLSGAQMALADVHDILTGRKKGSIR